MMSKNPECYNYYCTADPDLGMCIHCGAEMFEFEGFWYHHSQRDIHPESRTPQMVQSESQKEE